MARGQAHACNCNSPIVIGVFRPVVWVTSRCPNSHFGKREKNDAVRPLCASPAAEGKIPLCSHCSHSAAHACKRQIDRAFVHGSSAWV
jgi:hypothetical protein